MSQLADIATILGGTSVVGAVLYGGYRRLRAPLTANEAAYAGLMQNDQSRPPLPVPRRHSVRARVRDVFAQGKLVEADERFNGRCVMCPPDWDSGIGLPVDRYYVHDGDVGQDQLGLSGWVHVHHVPEGRDHPRKELRYPGRY